MTRSLRFVLVLGSFILLLAPLAAAVETEVDPGTDDNPATTEVQGDTSQCATCPTSMAGTILSVNANGSLVASTDGDKVVVDLGSDIWVRAFAWDPLYNYAIIVGENGAIIKLTVDGHITSILSGTTESLWLVSWMPVNDQASGSNQASSAPIPSTTQADYALILGQNGTILKWDGERIIHIMEKTGSDLETIEWSADGDYALIKGKDGKVFRYPPETDQSPFLVINEPVDGAIVSNTVSVRGVAMDPDGSIIKVEVRVDGGTWSTADGSSKWSRAVDLSSLSNGQHIIYARAYDGTIYSSPVKILVEVINDLAPTVSIIYPQSGQSIPDKVSITGMASDPEGQLDRVMVKIDDGIWYIADGTETWGYEFDPAFYGPGTHVISAQSFDVIGQASEITYITSFVGQRTNEPYAIILQPIDGRTYTTTDDIGFEALADDFTKDDITFTWESSIDGQVGVGAELTKRLTIGHHILTVTATDGELDASASVAIDVVDKTNIPPNVMFLTPKEGSRVSGTVTITGGAEDDQHVMAIKIKVDGGSWKTIQGNKVWYSEWDTTTVQDGDHVITAMAYDGKIWSKPVSLKVRVGNQKLPKIVLGPTPPVSPERQVDGPTTGKVDGRAVSVIALASSIMVLAIIISIVESMKIKFLSMFLVPLYCRINKDEVLDNFTRGAIYGFIVANPGAHYNLIKQELRLNNGAIIYHLDILERKGYVSSEKAGIFKKYYPKGFKKETSILEMLTDLQRRIFHEIEANPGVSQKEIAVRMNITARALNYHIKTLLKAQLIMLERVGRRTLCFINGTADPRQAEPQETTGA